MLSLVRIIYQINTVPTIYVYYKYVLYDIAIQQNYMWWTGTTALTIALFTLQKSHYHDQLNHFFKGTS
jgi:hypothetical protein